VAGVGSFEAALSVSLSLFLFTRVFYEMCDDARYRDEVLRGLGALTGAVGLAVGLVVGLWIVAMRRSGLEAVRVLVCSSSALCAGCTVFAFNCVMASQIPISMVSLCFAYRPWWRASNWVTSVFAALFIGGMAFCGTAPWTRRST
jgi:hypothetical protein